MTAVEFIEPLSHDEGVKNATDLFRATYGEEPAGVWAAPGRVNLIGEHTDYNAGLCLPIALPHRTFIALKPREDTKVRVVSDVGPGQGGRSGPRRSCRPGAWMAGPPTRWAWPGLCAKPASMRCRASTRHSPPACRSVPV